MSSAPVLMHPGWMFAELACQGAVRGRVHLHTWRRLRKRWLTCVAIGAEFLLDQAWLAGASIEPEHVVDFCVKCNLLVVLGVDVLHRLVPLRLSMTRNGLGTIFDPAAATIVAACV